MFILTLAAVTNPAGPPAAKGLLRVLWGGGWRNEPVLGRSASLYRSSPNSGGIGVGFRIAVPLLPYLEFGSEHCDADGVGW